MKDIIEKDNCTGCMACMNICPKKAIKIESEKDGFAYPKIDSKICIECGLCKKVCPVINKLKENINEIEAYACKNKDENTRINSSSGGIFTLIAEWILKENGVVFGARFNDNMEVVHDYIQNVEELKFFRGSKYIQSQIGNSYQKVKEFLNQERKVLFTGTPCQVEGLLSYLGKEYDNLYTQDIICHGVPSPKVWEKYLRYKNKNEKPKEVNFRNKKVLGWSNYQVYYRYNNSKENTYYKEDMYMQLFLQNIILRKSCYDCHFKKLKRCSDITLADFWGINKVNPEFYDEKGVSAILVNSRKGKEIFENIKETMEFLKVDMKNIIKHNISICKSVEYNTKREQFFEDLDNKDIEFLLRKYL